MSDSAAPPSASAIRRALRRARDGATLDATEAEILLAVQGDDLADLMASAARVRDAGLAAASRPATVTYSRKVFIPLTRLCRDRCHYCTFATTPNRVEAPYLSPDEVLDIARRGAELGCKEALFTLGDRPEERWPAAREWLDAHGYDSTLGYVRAMAIRVLEETGLLPHLNPGVLSWEDFQRLKPVAPSMGMMLETTSRALFEEPGGCHFGSPDKDPDVRLRVLEDAGRSAVPFTTGVLVGIGETLAERAEAIFAIRAVSRRYRGIQEVIVQGFRAKDDTAMRRSADLSTDALLAAVAVTRLLLGPSARVQSPPNLVDLDDVARLLAAGVDDFGGVSPLTPDHVNPERPWPQTDALAAASAAAGFRLTERLTAHPQYLAEPWLDPRLAGHVAALADPQTGLADENARPAGLPWQEPDGGLGDGLGGGLVSAGRTDLHTAIDDEGRRTDRRSDFATAYGDWAELTVADAAKTRGSAVPVPASADRLRPAYAAALREAESRLGSMSDAAALTLFDPLPGAEIDALAALADDVRRDRIGDEVTYVVNRNINFTNVCYTGCRFCAFAQRRTDADAYSLSLTEVGDRADQAWEVGATEICMQGGIHPDLPGTAYFDLAREVKRRQPGLHLHAFSPMEVLNGAARTGMSFTDWLTAARDAGLDSIPGTAAEILDDDVRWLLTKGKLPAATWVEVVTAAHRVGLPSSATMMYGHVDTPEHWLGHLRLLRRIQEETGGFTEFVPLPFVHANSPIYLAGLARPGPTVIENRAVHAMARLLLAGAIDSVQCSWVKLGVDGCRDVLAGGANDLGGTLMEETISRMAGSQHGSRKSVEELESVAVGMGRPVRQRTTIYGAVDDERQAAARRSDLRSSLPLLTREAS
ncbi:MAG TPA: bifunctional FO biosynthesis protein CofGH [Frankiaceae bacterium]|nr:bifunctional FO biosynthesis protein CofGH [Frankiaceae bacterium]